MGVISIDFASLAEVVGTASTQRATRASWQQVHVDLAEIRIVREATTRWNAVESPTLH